MRTNSTRRKKGFGFRGSAIVCMLMFSGCQNIFCKNMINPYIKDTQGLNRDLDEPKPKKFFKITIK